MWLEWKKGKVGGLSGFRAGKKGGMSGCRQGSRREGRVEEGNRASRGITFTRQITVLCFHYGGGKFECVEAEVIDGEARGMDGCASRLARLEVACA